MRTLIAAMAAAVMFGPSVSLAADDKSPKNSEQAGAMDCDHPHADEGNASAKTDWRKAVVRGEKIDKPVNIRLADLIASPDKENGKPVVVEGKVRRACTRMGCWMELAEAEQGPGVRVTFKNYGFFVPLDSAGAKAKVAGTVRIVNLSEAAAAHYRAEGARVPADSNGSRREVQLVASGVELRR
jgi:hypothetical protein